MTGVSSIVLLALVYTFTDDLTPSSMPLNHISPPRYFVPCPPLPALSCLRTSCPPLPNCSAIIYTTPSLDVQTLKIMTRTNTMTHILIPRVGNLQVQKINRDVTQPHPLSLVASSFLLFWPFCVPSPLGAPPSTLHPRHRHAFVSWTWSFSPPGPRMRPLSR